MAQSIGSALSDDEEFIKQILLGDVYITVRDLAFLMDETVEDTVAMINRVSTLYGLGMDIPYGRIH